MTSKNGSSKPTTWMRAAECAERTGLSVRALRIYERERLIKPTRAANGWRRYGPVELARLNTITVLKSLGLTLGQIRALLSERSPSLEGILRIQAETWKARKAAAGTALIRVEAALNHLQTHQSPSIDDLCNLIRSFEMNDLSIELKELIAQHITADESHAWTSWWSNHPEDLAETQQFLEAQNILFAQLVEHMNAGDDSGSAAVQAVIDKHNRELLKYHMRERGIRQLDWNASVTVKWYAIGYRARERNQEQKSASDAPPGVLSRDFSGYLIAAYEKSEYGRLITALLAQVNRLVAAGDSPSSESAIQLARKFQALCSQYSLGDAAVYARYTPFISRVSRGGTEDPGKERVWDFLLRAVRADGNTAPVTS